jgi:glutaredoxin-like protein
MERLLSEDIQKQLKEVLSAMIKPVKMVLFTKPYCETCKETKMLLNEVSELSDKIYVEEKDIDKDSDEADLYDVNLTPSFVLLNSDNVYQGVKFNGIPAGHEINSFLSALLFMSGVDLGLDQATIEKIMKIDKPINIKVFITLSCPHCPGAVSTAHKMAILNKNIKAEMVESQTFMDMARKYKVSGVPKIVINEKHELVGNHPIESFLAEIAKI